MGSGEFKIAIDAMGGDNAPQAIVEGALMASRDHGVSLILVGQEEPIRHELERHRYDSKLVEVRHAPEVVEMEEDPARAVRRKRQASIIVALELVKYGEAKAVVSAGNTGASLAASTFILRPMKGIDRPAIAAILPTMLGNATILDVGANVDCQATQLLQFGIMGSVYAKYIFNKPNPTVGLLSIGEEDSKGNEATKEAFQFLKNSSINFIGNIEGREVYRGYADVIVCDGFAGNIAIKISESVAELFDWALETSFKGSWYRRLGNLLWKREFNRIASIMDYTEYGGAPLLGVNGNCIVAHGRSSPKAIRSAVNLAQMFVENRINEHIQEDLEFNSDIQVMGKRRGRFWKNLKESIPFSHGQDETEGDK
jgi:glycerol-3-phosphate acyltransferase PlsX